MLKRVGYYRSALYVASAIVVAELAFVFSATRTFSILGVFADRVLIALVIVLGLWLHSNAVRYLGALWFVVTVGAVVWPLFANEKVVFSVAVVCMLVLAVLCLMAAYILLLSRPFAEEFRHQRETEPEYKATLRKTALIVILAAVVVLTAIDIYRMSSS
jgi:hypothetical protein